MASVWGGNSKHSEQKLYYTVLLPWLPNLWKTTAEVIPKAVATTGYDFKD